MEQVVDNKYTKEMLESIAEDSDAVYHRTRTEFFMKVFWIGAVAAIFFINYSALDPSQLSSHIVTFISGVMAVKGFQLIDPYLDTAEEAGLIIPEEGDESDE